MYEQHLKMTFPKHTEISYDLAQLFEYCNQLTELSILVFQKSSHSYAPHDKEWVKEKLYMMLRQQVEREQRMAKGVDPEMMVQNWYYQSCLCILAICQYVVTRAAHYHYLYHKYNQSFNN